MANILTIAGSDPSGSSGTTVDVEVIRALGHRPLTVITAITAQNDRQVYSINPVDTKVLKDQIEALFSQYSFEAIKIGLLATKGIVDQISRILKSVGCKNLIIDPIIKSSSGTDLLESSAIPMLTQFLFPRARLVTPNLDEAETLSGLKVRNPGQMSEAAYKILQLSPGLNSVLIKGGHLEEEKIDILLENNHITSFQRLDLSGNLRGTGCILSSAIACHLAEGRSLVRAVQEARLFLQDFIRKRAS